MRGKFQGVTNIIKFNWHFYVIATAFIFFLLWIAMLFNGTMELFTWIGLGLAVWSIVVSLIASYYVYDRSGFYALDWIEEKTSPAAIVNVNAGFDETSLLLQVQFPTAELTLLDFYDPEKHTEISIKRARKKYPAPKHTKSVTTSDLPLTDDFADIVFVVFAAHEIRNFEERVSFFKELKRILKPDGKIYVIEHLRDLSNFSVYSIGFFHFYPRKDWLSVFQKAQLSLTSETKINAFVTKFILEKNGTSF